MKKIIALCALLLSALLLSSCFAVLPLLRSVLRPPEATVAPTPRQTAEPTQKPAPRPTAEPAPDASQDLPLYRFNANRAEEHLRNGETEEAILAYEAAIRYAILENNCPQQELAELYLTLSRIYEGEGRDVRALAVLLGAKERAGESREIADGIARLLADDGAPANRAAKSAYLSVLRSLISAHGQYAAAEGEWVDYPLGVFHAQLVDCDADGVDELLCIYGTPRPYTYEYDGETYEEVRNIPCVELYAYRDGEAALLLQECVGYYFAQSDDYKEVLVCRADGDIWINFYLDTADFCDAFYTVREGNLVSRVYRARIPEDAGFDVDTSVYDVAGSFEIDGTQVSREVFELQHEAMQDRFYGPEEQTYEWIYIPPDEFWAWGYGKYVDALLLTLGG
ncbi:MAG TPA: PT domain-containing protein [Clostridia bacterium]|nr:PT domain-containing protein [Clostridia bacterium]